jgi:hypothetical protein
MDSEEAREIPSLLVMIHCPIISICRSAFSINPKTGPSRQRGWKRRKDSAYFETFSLKGVGYEYIRRVSVSNSLGSGKARRV